MKYQNRKRCPRCGGSTPHVRTLYGYRCKKCGNRKPTKSADENES